MRTKLHESEEMETVEVYTQEDAVEESDKSRKADKEVDLSKLKKRDLLEIMLRQSEEIDRLRVRVAELEEQLNDFNFNIDRVGSIAEASLAVTNIFKEAEKAATIYLNNIRSKVK